ncbi:unnamed protein product [Lactuca virosa]|uniref:Toll/interleukin-1 receptor (TIR) domain-containing protein n=1 Tax=Lactuca virosa TaxID=75947 RepID=A0AAU9MNK5_9ASTR|nr:unnamed protein product [Lactuca virosa]
MAVDFVSGKQQIFDQRREKSEGETAITNYQRRSAVPTLTMTVVAAEEAGASGAVENAFAKHENKEAAGKWRDALKEAADLAGWGLKNTADRHEAKFIQKIVEELSLELRAFDFNIDEKFVGMETRINDVLLSLGTGSDDVCMIGIKGIGGGGKTTLAKAVFDQISFQFESKSFVESVREVSKASLSGLKSLQNQIISDVLNDRGISVSSVHDGINIMKRRMPGKKVLLVLDDVDHIEQLEVLAGETNWFKPGSRIIITTRDEQVLVAHRVKSIHDVKLLSEEEAICLFSRYAFGRVIPNLGYEKLVQRVIYYAAGLPLTIKVLGSFLCGKNEFEWIDAIERLKTIPLLETLKKLELSYISLEEDYKEIFLDVACILKGWSKANAIKALESCGFHARSGLRVLEQRSLITVDHSGYLGMHDRVEEMGRNIIRCSHPDKPYKHSRLWINKEIEDILSNDLGTEATRYIQFYSWKVSAEVVMKGLRKMKELRFLHVSGGSFEASHYPKHLKQIILLHLRWLTAKSYIFGKGEKERFLNKLRFLDLSYSKLRTLNLLLTPNIETLNLKGCGDLVELYELARCLKLITIDLSYSMLRTINLGSTPSLKLLDLGDCWGLVELHMPGRYPNLRSIKLNNSKLRTLDIGPTPNLEYLDLKNCNDLEELHIADGCLKKLVYLDLSGCLRFKSFKFKIKNDTFPTNNDSSCSENESLEIGPLAELYLIVESLDGCPLHPGNNLPKFQFTCFYKEDRPLLTRNLEKLISVGLCACTNLDAFSRSICGLQHLRVLKFKGSILEAPKDLDQLECLEKLDLSDTGITDIPESLCMLKHLKSLKLDFCFFLEKLPKDLGRLECLKELILSYAKIKDLPDSICMLKHLEFLELFNCRLLEKLPEDFGQLESLENLNLNHCELLQDIPDSICEMKCLKRLSLNYCIQLEKFPEELGHLECLKQLDLGGVYITHLPQSIFLLKGVRIYGSRGLLQSFGFTFEIQTTAYEELCYVMIQGQEKTSRLNYYRKSNKGTSHL